MKRGQCEDCGAAFTSRGYKAVRCAPCQIVYRRIYLTMQQRDRRWQDAALAAKQARKNPARPIIAADFLMACRELAERRSA